MLTTNFVVDNEIFQRVQMRYIQLTLLISLTCDLRRSYLAVANPGNMKVFLLRHHFSLSLLN